MPNKYDEIVEPSATTRANKYDEIVSPAPQVSPLKAGGKAAFESLGGAGGALAGGELGATLGSFGGPIGTVVGGLGGALAGGYLGSKAQEKVGEVVPKEIKEATGFTPEQRAAEREAAPASTFVGGIAPDVAAAGPTLYRLGKYGATKASDLVSSFKKPQPFATAEGLDVVGEKGFKLLTDKFEKLFKARKTEADDLYDDAFVTARQTQAQGNPFATSPQGQALLQALEAEKRVVSGEKTLLKGQEKIAGIDRLIDAIKGVTKGGERTAKEIERTARPAAKIFSQTPKKTTEKDIEAVVEELRFLRDVDAKGKPYEAYAALSTDYKRDLIKKLESALYDWSPEYKTADQAYRAASQKLEPFKTRLMENALKGEKFDPKSLVASPEKFGPKFFSNVDGVRQLKEVTQDPSSVAQLGKEYVASILSNKTPQEVKTFAMDAKNFGWMRKAGIYDDVVNYANKAATAADRKEILKKIGYGAAGAGIVSAVGSPFYYGVRRALGL